MTETVETETLELFGAQMEVVLRMTGGDPDLQQPKLRALTRAVHLAKYNGRFRWELTLTEEEVESLYYVLSVYFLNHGEGEKPFTRTLCGQSVVYRRLHLAEQNRAQD